MVNERKAISRKYFLRTRWFPVTALMFGLGGFDEIARNKSQYGVTEMREEDKQWSLWVAVPLGTILYAIVGLVVAILVLFAHSH